VILAGLAIVSIIVAGLVFWPLIRAVARRIEGKAVDPALMAEVEHLRSRVAELEGVQHRLAELEERVDFSERLLAQGRSGQPAYRRA
jgi:Tfp pilus assembly protein PilO